MPRRQGKSLIKAISDLFRMSSVHVARQTAEYRIGRGQWYILNQLLFGGDGITQEDLSQRMFVDKAATARSLALLEAEGYVFRKVCAENASKKLVYVTQKARDIETPYHQIFKDLNAAMTRGFTPEETRLAGELLFRMRDNLAEAVSAPRPPKPSRRKESVPHDD